MCGYKIFQCYRVAMLCLGIASLIACGSAGTSNSSASLPSLATSSAQSSTLAPPYPSSSALSSSLFSSSLLSSSTTASSLSNTQRVSAATDTAQNNSICIAVKPFYWEVGDKLSALGSGTTGDNTYTADSIVPIASASKWIFGAYLAQLRDGHLTSDDIASLTMRAGYTNFSDASCIRLLSSMKETETVNECFQAANSNGGNNSDFNPNAVGHFFYGGGHFQKSAVDLGLGLLNNASLQAEVQRLLGTDFNFIYTTPQVAGGVATSAASYAIFLRKILNNQLAIYGLLGSNKVCTNIYSTTDSTTCINTPIYTPAPASEHFVYSLGHWLEDDPVVGDGAFSSAGTFGFYPWIDASKTFYGIVARKDDIGSGFESVYCGRLIRKAWITGIEQ
ncbi:MAG: hypothetical protein V4732_06230 [Pseudomonadota bacterium]